MSAENFSNSSQSDNNFFSGIYNDNSLKTVLILFHIAFTVTGPLLLYSIIWYERYSADIHHRTLINQLLSNICMINLVNCFSGRILANVLFVTGPNPVGPCSASILWNKFWFLAIIQLLLTQQIAKVFYVFKWKLVVGLNENFFARFFTSCIIISSALMSFVSFFLGFKCSGVDFHIYTGRHPKANIEAEAAFLYRANSTTTLDTFAEVTSNDPYSKISMFLILSLAIISAFLWPYSVYSKRKLVKPIELMLTAGSKDAISVTKNTIVGNGGNLLVALMMILLVVPKDMQKRVALNDIDQLNFGHGKVLVYAARMSVAFMSYYLLPFVILITNAK